MAGEWIKCILADACRSIDYGLTASASEYEVGPKFLRITDIVNGHIDWNAVPHVAADEVTAAKYRLYDGDIVLARTGASTGASAYVKNPPPAVFASYLVRLQAKPEFDARFLAYYLRSDTFWTFIRGVLGDKSAQPNASASTMTKAPLRAPKDKNEQRAVAHILGTLDDKIELNRRMSQTLEAMARALFKSWFVDFEPVRAKMVGRWQRGQSLPGLPAHLYDLFPDRLVDSELGEIPEGWEVGTLGQVLGELVSGARPKGGAAQEGVPSVGAENVIGLGRYDFSKEKYVPRDFFNELQRKGAAVRPGDVLLYKDGAQIGRKTYFDCGFPHEQCAVNEHVFIVRAKHAHYQRYLFFWLDQDWMTQEIISLNSNSAQPGINQQGVRALPLLKPPDAMVEAFDRLSKKLTDRLFAACHESRTLAALRDALLPKLIRGEIRVKDAQRFLNTAMYKHDQEGG
jgi:type I restriction enzyme S subunit